VLELRLDFGLQLNVASWGSTIMRDENELWAAIDRARSQINQGKGPLAVRYLGEIRRDVEDSGNPQMSAHHQLAFAEALATNCDRSAELEFQEAVEQVSNLPERDGPLELRAREHHGNCLCRKGRRSLAMREYELAKKLAIEFGSAEDRARIQMSLISITLEIDKEEIDKDPRAPDFRNLKNAAKDGDCTWQEQLGAWFRHLGDSEADTGLSFARERGSVDYFRGLLKSMREEI
jgi:hypothetical protein